MTRWMIENLKGFCIQQMLFFTVADIIPQWANMAQGCSYRQLFPTVGRASPVVTEQTSQPTTHPRPL